MRPLRDTLSMLSVASKFGMDLVLAHPEGYDLHPDVLDKVRENVNHHVGSFNILHYMDEACRNANVVYAKSWTARHFWPPTTEQIQDEEGKRLAEVNNNWICDRKRVSLAKKTAIYLHCLPCNRGYEVTADVIDGLQSAVFDEVENKLHAQKAIMSLLMR